MRSFLSNDLEPVAYLVYMVALFLQYIRHKQVRHQVLFFYYLVAAFSLYAGIILPADNNWSYNLLFFINICVFSWYFYRLMLGEQKKIIIAVCAVVNVIVFIYFNIIGTRFFSDFNSYVFGIAFLSIVLYTLFYLHQLLADVKEENLLLNFDFWLTCGYLLYFLGSFVIIIYYQHAEARERGNMWIMQNIILFICSVSILVAYIKMTKKQRAMPW